MRFLALALALSACSFDSGIELGDGNQQPGLPGSEPDPGDRDPEPTTEPEPPDPEPTESECAMVELTAVFYGPLDWEDAVVLLDDERTVRIPDSLEVIEGGTGGACAFLFLEEDYDDWVACAYQGSSTSALQSYRLVECRANSMSFDACGEPSSGEVVDPRTVPTERLTLSVYHEYDAAWNGGPTIVRARVGDCGPYSEGP